MKGKVDKVNRKSFSGFTLDGQDVWYNLVNRKKAPDLYNKLVEKVKTLNKGDEVELTINSENEVSFIKTVYVPAPKTFSHNTWKQPDEIARAESYRIASENKMASVVVSYAKDLIVAGKIPLEEMQKYSIAMYNLISDLPKMVTTLDTANKTGKYIGDDDEVMEERIE